MNTNESVHTTQESVLTCTYVGIADCHGIDKFEKPGERWKPVLHAHRAKLNPQRHAVAFLATLNSTDAEVIEALLVVNRRVDALSTLRNRAISIRLANNDDAVASWEMIPEPSLDPYCRESIKTAMECGEPIVSIYCVRLVGGRQVALDGERRLWAANSLGPKGSLGGRVVREVDFPDGCDDFNVIVPVSASSTT